MKQFLDVYSYELKMSIRRKSLWISFGMICLFFILGLNTTTGDGLLNHLIGRDFMLEAAETVFTMNMFSPLLVGVLASDRLQRDTQNNIRELQKSTGIGIWKYLLTKYIGVVSSVFLVGLVGTLVHGAFSIVVLDYSPIFLLAEAVVFSVMLGPAFAFVTAFSLGIPLFLPVRVYQILFTGYWVWGNLLTSRLVPSISDTVLNASGMFALQGFYGSTISPVGSGPHNALEAWINICVILLLTILALLVTGFLIKWQTNRK